MINKLSKDLFILYYNLIFLLSFLAIIFLVDLIVLGPAHIRGIILTSVIILSYILIILLIIKEKHENR